MKFVISSALSVHEWVTLNLANVVFDTNTGKYYTPNTNAIVDMNGDEKDEGGNQEQQDSDWWLC